MRRMRAHRHNGVPFSHFLIMSKFCFPWLYRCGVPILYVFLRLINTSFKGGQLTTSLPTAEITKRQYYGLLTTNLSNFHASPVLNITDVDMLLLCDPESPKWRPRRFSTTWTLYDTILHATYRRTAPVTPVVGVHSDLSVLVNQIRLRGSRVTFMSTPLRKQPFEYLRREGFRLKHTISESDIPSDLIRQVLLLEHTRQSQDDDTAEEYLADNGRRANTTAN